ncbi:MAG: protein-methionine-sulfoxide reductase catalytic subunit MsrP [Nitrospirae bacterium]|nr:protein-methionine-sulfoxide reductase catalytic subunit MsrP [Nitrospirota bacterium]
MLIKKADDIKSSEITDESLYLKRRSFLVTAFKALAFVLVPSVGFSEELPQGKKLSFTPDKSYTVEDDKTSYDKAISYNNFYEFSLNKEDVKDLSRNFKVRPWTVTVDGLVKKTTVYDIDHLIKTFPQTERIYRHRCVEGWSMVIPWIGFQLSDLIKQVEPDSRARYVKFTSVYNPDVMIGQKTGTLNWPYVEGLRLDEALNPLTLLAVGMYGHEMPNQNGAPLRLVVPWKYGFKGIKSIVRITFTDSMPVTSWNLAGPTEYGFYANVNPNVDHPRWSQGTERRIGNFFRQKTLLFNGYQKEVASLYTGMDLTKNF